MASMVGGARNCFPSSAIGANAAGVMVDRDRAPFDTERAESSSAAGVVSVPSTEPLGIAHTPTHRPARQNRHLASSRASYLQRASWLQEGVRDSITVGTTAVRDFPQLEAREPECLREGCPIGDPTCLPRKIWDRGKSWPVQKGAAWWEIRTKTNTMGHADRCTSWLLPTTFFTRKHTTQNPRDVSQGVGNRVYVPNQVLPHTVLRRPLGLETTDDTKRPHD